MKDNEITNILLKITKGYSLEAEEQSFLDEWKKNNLIHQTIYSFFLTRISINALPESSIDSESIYRRIKENIENEASQQQRKKHVLQMPFLRQMLKYTAIFVLGAISITAILQFRETQPTFCEISVPRGSISEVMLPDSSIVTLNSNSSIRYASNFLSNNRNVYLKGEAFFKVKKQKSENRFTVYSKDSKIVVKGTEFNVRAYLEEKDIEATLIKGIIEFKANKRSITMKPKQQIIYTPNGQHIVLREHNPEEMDWRSGMYTFKDQRLKEVIRAFNRIYDASIVLDASVENIEFSGYINKKNTMRHSLDIVLLTTGTQSQLRNNSIYINK
ncbi:MAG: FecR family protein [Bacteroidaceae bacterium]